MRIGKFNNFKMINESNSFEDYIEAILKVVQGRQKEFYDWQKQVANPVEILHYKDVFPNISPNWIKKNCKIKQCYNNATNVLNLDPEIKYVEGVVMLYGQIPISHAWNSYKGKHFDLTSELWEVQKEKDLHTQLIELDYEQVWEFLHETGVYGELVNEVFKKIKGIK